MGSFDVVVTFQWVVRFYSKIKSLQFEHHPFYALQINSGAVKTRKNHSHFVGIFFLLNSPSKTEVKCWTAPNRLWEWQTEDWLLMLDTVIPNSLCPLSLSLSVSDRQRPHVYTSVHVYVNSNICIDLTKSTPNCISASHADTNTHVNTHLSLAHPLLPLIINALWHQTPRERRPKQSTFSYLRLIHKLPATSPLCLNHCPTSSESYPILTPPCMLNCLFQYVQYYKKAFFYKLGSSF